MWVTVGMSCEQCVERVLVVRTGTVQRVKPHPSVRTWNVVERVGYSEACRDVRTKHDGRHL